MLRFFVTRRCRKHRSWVCQAWQVFLFFAFMVAAPRDGHAAFIDCQDIQRTGQDQIVVGDVALGSQGDAAAAELARRRLQQRLRQQLADLAISLGSSVYTVSCPGHAPHLSDYTRGIVARRYGSGVLVELWGIASGADAWITYALLPLLPPGTQGTAPAGYYDLGYSIDPQGGIAGVFAEARELRAFTALSAGLRALSRAKQTPDSELYSHAYAALCQAEALLAEAERYAGAGGLEASDWAALRTLARTRAGEAQSGAAAIGQAGGGALATPPTGVTIGSCEISPPDPPFPVSETSSTSPP